MLNDLKVSVVVVCFEWFDILQMEASPRCWGKEIEDLKMNVLNDRYESKVCLLKYSSHVPRLEIL